MNELRYAKCINRILINNIALLFVVYVVLIWICCLVIMQECTRGQSEPD